MEKTNISLKGQTKTRIIRVTNLIKQNEIKLRISIHQRHHQERNEKIH